jgi:hypothetical protein
MVIGSLAARSAAQKTEASGEAPLSFAAGDRTCVPPVTQADWSQARRRATMRSPHLRQIRVDERHRRGAFADRAANALYRSRPHVTDCIHAGDA